jgi:hypothetical protein
MTPFRALIIAISLAFVFTGSNIWTKQAIAGQMVATPMEMDTTSVLDETAGGAGKPGAPRDDWAEPRVDLNGNEIDDAVGDYRVDRRGEMYERHAPDTALSHLGAPRM